jgi:hypothetical protein
MHAWPEAANDNQQLAFLFATLDNFSLTPPTRKMKDAA